MIGYLSGKVIEKSATGAIILVGGVGYDVTLPTSILGKIHQDSETELWIYSHIREDQFSLFGFAEKEELEFFKQLLSVSGIGPKAAIAIVSSAPISKLKSSISAGDPTLLSAVSGVGRKTAEKAVVELKNKISAVGSSSEIFAGSDTEDVLNALIQLGFQRAEASSAIAQLPEDTEGTDAKLKAALKILGNKR
jgi:Holliday junction DNA helicase RuvA